MLRWFKPVVPVVLAGVMNGVLPAPARADAVPDPVTVYAAPRTYAKPHKSGPDNNTPTWANNSMTGYCGQTDGGFVVAAQTFLYAWGAYPGPIDNVWGPKSHSALLQYQDARGLQRDGCGGPQTWADMQPFARYIGDTVECSGSGSLRVYRYAKNGRWAVYDRSTRTLYWYADTHLQPVGGQVGDHLYRFSDDLKPYC
jgi:hypothetical protein